jgi:uncharacterized membrane protein YccC
VTGIFAVAWWFVGAVALFFYWFTRHHYFLVGAAIAICAAIFNVANWLMAIGVIGPNKQR